MYVKSFIILTISILNKYIISTPSNRNGPNAIILDFFLFNLYKDTGNAIQRYSKSFKHALDGLN
jgi:hypothetical protein